MVELLVGGGKEPHEADKEEHAGAEAGGTGEEALREESVVLEAFGERALEDGRGQAHCGGHDEDAAHEQELEVRHFHLGVSVSLFSLSGLFFFSLFSFLSLFFVCVSLLFLFRVSYFFFSLSLSCVFLSLSLFFFFVSPYFFPLFMLRFCRI